MLAWLIVVVFIVNHVHIKDLLSVYFIQLQLSKAWMV